MSEDVTFNRPGNPEKSIDDLAIGVRAYNGLCRINVRTLGELMQKTERELLDIKHVGRKTLLEIKEALAEEGLTLKG